MRISTKGRYGLAAMTVLGREKDCPKTAAATANSLGVSKIYLEQVFALLKSAGLVQTQKGAAGGYFVSKEPVSITALEILKALEPALFEPAENGLQGAAQNLGACINQTVFTPLDRAVEEILVKLTLQDLIDKAGRDTEYMFYI